ncbi:response regulator transcription factor [Eubacteriaceae bacterium ES2]|nr:response regulator transcription factor [Eubacteriaceae bacterium ES2]
MAKILVIEDDEEIALIERDYLEVSGHEVVVREDGKNILNLLQEGDFNLLILDLMLPDINGYEICKMVRKQFELPILMVTAKTETIDKIRGLGLGADDYIAKPFDPAELIARVNSHLKRFERLTNVSKDPKLGTARHEEKSILIADIKILVDSWQVFKGEEEIKLPHREFELLKFLAINPNIVFSKESLFEKIWGYDYIGDSATVTVHINRIRDKIEEDSKNPQIIETIWGAGYRLNMR